MKRFDSNNYYVGHLNISQKIANSLLLTGLSKDASYSTKHELMLSTIVNGAVSLQNIISGSLTDWNKRLRYDTILTIFYKLDDNNYYCLHNGKKYSITGDDYCSNLIPIKDIIPKIDYQLNDKMSHYEAKMLFRGLFKKDNYFKYNKLHDINDFYCGKLELCTGYRDVNQKWIYMNLNVPSQIILFKSHHLYRQSGFSKIIDNKECDFSNFHCCFLRIGDNLFNNINDYQYYVLDKKDDLVESYIRISMPLSKCFDYNGIRYSNEISIDKVLELQKRIKS